MPRIERTDLTLSDLTPITDYNRSNDLRRLLAGETLIFNHDPKGSMSSLYGAVRKRTQDTMRLSGLTHKINGTRDRVTVFKVVPNR